ncbi:MFS transporter [Bacillus carboniphilus]|uniref:MFS transporter n=1 Tax=Bacillus carboniphilus TaxID=86663 RepID=A0ABN0W9E8_9BACI
MNRKILLYMKAFSDFGMFMDTIVLNVVVYAATGSTAWLAATMAARTIGGVISSLFSGVLADRYDRRKIMIISDIVRALIILLLIPFPNPVMIIVVSFLIGLISSSFMVSFSAEVPKIFGETKILETNSLISRLTSVSLVAGFLGAGLITEFLGYKITLTIDAASYILSALVLLKIRWDTDVSKKVEVNNTVLQKVQSIWTDIKEVHAYLLLAPMILFVNVVFLMGSFAGSSHNLGIPLLAESISFESQSFYYGMIWAVWGMGSIIATFTLPKLTWLKGDKVYFACFISAMLMSTGFIVFLSSSNLWIIFAFAAFTGVFDASFTTLHATILQKTDNHIRGRIFGVGMLLKSLGFAVGFIIAPTLLKVMDMPQMVWILHGTLITVTIVIVLLAGKHLLRLKNAQTNGISL